MDVGMAIGAFASNITENHFGVALGAGYVLMQAAQRVTGLVVIKLGHAADGSPTAEGVAVLAWDIEGAMRAVRARSPLLRLHSRRAKHGEQQQGDRFDSCGPSQGIPPRSRVTALLN